MYTPSVLLLYGPVLSIRGYWKHALNFGNLYQAYFLRPLSQALKINQRPHSQFKTKKSKLSYLLLNCCFRACLADLLSSISCLLALTSSSQESNSRLPSSVMSSLLFLASGSSGFSFFLDSGFLAFSIFCLVFSIITCNSLSFRRVRIISCLASIRLTLSS